MTEKENAIHDEVDHSWTVVFYGRQGELLEAYYSLITGIWEVSEYDVNEGWILTYDDSSVC